VRSRELGVLLRGFRERLGLTAAQAAAGAGLSPAVLSRIETAARAFPQSGLRNVRALASYYKLDARTTERLVALAKEAAEPGWWQRYDLESSTATYLGLESAASSIETFEAMVVPGLLQTKEYAREIIGPARADFTPEQLQEALDSRMARQEILSSENPLVLHAVIDEAVISRVFAGSDVMRAQLEHIRQVVNELSNVTVQVLPFSVAINPGSDGPFVIMNFTEEFLPGVVYAEGQLGQLFDDDPQQVERVKGVFMRLAGLALDPAQSLALIDKKIHELETLGH
jgi:transcriptional regulator with XRE-family HTH domain